MASAGSPMDTLAGVASASSGSASPPQSVFPKHVQFELLVTDSPQHKARLPLRVQIFPHDSTESIVTTVVNFYGLYSRSLKNRPGLSFQDDQQNTLIASYQNFRNNMVVYVRVEDKPSESATLCDEPEFAPTTGHLNGLPRWAGDYPDQAYPAAYPTPKHHQLIVADSRISRRRSPSPGANRGRRSDSNNSRKGRWSSKNRSLNCDNESDSANGYSSGDGASGSVSSSKAKEQIGNTDISVENIVEGGRRKRAKFESSELPLFAPPQMPAATSNSSVSPARRVEHHRSSVPFVHPGQRPFANPPPLQSPQANNNGYGPIGGFATPYTDSRRHRGSIGFAGASGVLPTPDPTVASCVSEEDKDVAIQLMRLGDMSNISHGRTSASTLDDTFSGKADAASSTGATSDSNSDSEDERPPARRQKLNASGSHHSNYQVTGSHFLPPRDGPYASGDDADYEDGQEDGSRLESGKAKAHNVGKSQIPKMARPKVPKVQKANNGPKPKKVPGAAPGPMSPTSLPDQSRNGSIASASAFNGQQGEDEQPDLSTKPRCQRCRKSKKGCDRQRPCGRCRDAGLSADQCVSEDEGNGRKGRYGRHMGVPLKTTEVPVPPTLLPAAPILPPMVSADKNKKRKR